MRMIRNENENINVDKEEEKMIIKRVIEHI
jgi:hypothetical protein